MSRESKINQGLALPNEKNKKKIINPSLSLLKNQPEKLSS